VRALFCVHCRCALSARNLATPAGCLNPPPLGRLPGQPVNQLKSHCLLLHAVGLQQPTPPSLLAATTPGLAPSVSPSATPIAVGTPAVALRCIASWLAQQREKAPPPYSSATIGHFGLASASAGRSKGSFDVPDSVGAGITPSGHIKPDLLQLAAAFPSFADNPAASPFSVTALTQLVSESLAGNCLTLIVTALTASGVPPGHTLSLLETVSALRRTQGFPIVNSTR